MCEFLAGDDLSRKIREVVKGKDVRCAVAFWGRDAVKELFGTEGLERDDVKILCDISMGGTNPATLERIIKHYPDNHGHVLGLHTKVYHSNAGMVVGSANASANGIGFDRQAAKHLETGIYLGPEAASWKTARKWFDELWKNSITLDETAIAVAGKTWRANRSIRHKIGRVALQSSLTEVGNLFESTRIVLRYDPFIQDQEVDYRAAAISVGLDPDANDFDPFESEGFAHDDWPESFIALYLDRKNIIPTFHQRGITEGDWHFPTTISWGEFLQNQGYPDAAIPAPVATEIRRQEDYKNLADKNRFFTVDDVLPLLE
jgi:hypothetical protein